MNVVILIIISAILVRAWYRGRSRARQRAFRRWSSVLKIPLAAGIVRSEIERVLGSNGCTLAERDEEIDLYDRGNPAVRSIPCQWDISWCEVPIVVGIMCRAIDGGTVVNVGFTALRSVEFSSEGAEFFRRQAANEFEIIREFLSLITRERSESERQQKHTNANHSGATGTTNGANAERDSDLALLGLKRASSWADVQGAYRDACRKYHPDRLAGKNLEPHLVELSVNRFQEVSGAYQRLRERMGHSQRC